MDHRASMISQQKQRRLVISNSDTNPLEQLASAFCAIDDDETQMISYIDFQSAERYSDDPQSSSDHQQAIPIRSSISTMINKAEDHTLVSVVNPNRLWRNNAKRYWSQQGSLLSLDHSKLLSEANLNLKVSLLSSRREQQSPNISSIPGTYCGSKSAASSNKKTRLKWTEDLHEKFVNCVNLLGGAERATPRAILKLMKSDGLTVFHVKSHLQKYRYTKCITNSTQGKPDQRIDDDDDDLPMFYLKSGMQVKEILEMQLQVQRRLCQQLEVQQNLQQAIKEQGKQIQMMLEQLKTNMAC